ncbi:amidohydrolase family protein [Rubricoccus marinus]|uniref:Amidohydrolase n=1 Tax=Rubricoccus marinus TaxID=716817 RepID=A0A259TYZ0_9BACT|nr:amidohydrolase family protein [Rubricoccus marinus]OZC02969.1 amidohydrolase [Rubricoccus marinus]
MLRLTALLALTLLASGARGQDDAPKWDVSAAHGPTSTVAFETSEGTWMSIDVSPDGRTLVFDLLGDLYTLPLAGGTATRITSGAAYDVQPRWSPDGSRISFTSDRSGGDNIWTMDARGQDMQQVTDESFRLLNNAVWTPDGDYLIARKHFTATRSLGAGEMWMYHRTGGSGLQLTERPNDQQDAGEPAVSPDGRYVYFSQDVTPGPFFEYNKDPNGGIYAIKRLDRETGEIETILGGTGGAARPEPSPDGRHLAFVRRVRNESVLFVYDTVTGAQRPLWDGLSPDQQETWAVFGVYPGFAWLPDASALVVWAQGGLWRVDAQTGTPTPIPFTAEVEQTVTEAVRFPVDVAPEVFDVKMLRDAATSPDGRTLVFSAVGRLWRKVGDREPQAIPTGEGFAFDPDFSPDGRQMVFATWSDEAFGQIHVLNTASGAIRTLPLEPGHYATPRFSPDGQMIVYAREGGNSMRGPLNGLRTGLYMTAASGEGEPQMIVDHGREPRFTPDARMDGGRARGRITFLDGGGLNKTFRSVDLDGSDERTHFTLKYPTTVVPSPDGRWVAFNEAFNVYVAPFALTGAEYDLNKDTEAVPVSRLSRDAGTDLHWTDNTTLRWLIGPEVYTRSLSDAFAFVDGAPASLPKPDSVGVPVGLRLPHDAPNGAIAITGARILTMDGDRVIENGTVVVTGNRITAVGEAGEVTVPSGAEVIDGRNHTIMPGIVDVHAHAGHFNGGPVPQTVWQYYANLAYGVTTAHDPSATTETVFTMAEMVKSGDLVGPRIFSTGTILYGADGDFRATVNSLDDAYSHIRRMKATGAISVKSYNQPRRDQRQQILKAARDLEMMVVPEGGSTFYHNMNMVIDGHTGIEHAVPVAPLHNDVQSLWRATEVAYTPTLVVGYGGLWGENYWYAKTNVWEDGRLLTFTPRTLVDAVSRRRTLVPDDEYWHVTLAEQTKTLTDLGVGVQLGAHGQMQGLAAHWELRMFGQGGMTNMEALRAATLNGAEYIGLDGDLGSVETGKLADLIILSADPSADLANISEIRYVMANGRLYNADTMDLVAPEATPRPPFWFEKDGSSDGDVWQGWTRHTD